MCKKLASDGDPLEKLIYALRYSGVQVKCETHPEGSVLEIGDSGTVIYCDLHGCVLSAFVDYHTGEEFASLDVSQTEKLLESLGR